MPLPLEKEALRDDLAFVEQQIAKHPDAHDTVRLMWDQRRAALQEEIAALEGQHDGQGRVALIFNGNPVVGSQEIKLDFTAKVLDNYQLVVTALAAERGGAELGARGRFPGAFTSKLFIRDMLRGSVGFLLEELEPAQIDLLSSPLKLAIEETTKVLNDLSGPEAGKFEERIRELSPRTVGAIKKLTKVLHDFGAETTIVDDENRLAIDQVATASLHSRLTDVDFAERTEKREGMLLGLFPERQQYEFKPADGSPVFYGPVSAALDARYLADSEFAHSILLKSVIATFDVNATIHAGHVQREEWILKDVQLTPGAG
jgi:hypothetical protein